jgi:8-amino-7-oxononanoate synthase
MEREAERHVNQYRNTKFVIENSRKYFDLAYETGLMGVYGRSIQGRHVESTEEDKEFLDFVRCSYLGLDNHPKIVAGALGAITEYQSLHWSCARTRLNFGLIRVLEEELARLFKARIIAFSTVMVANMGALPLLASGHLTNGHKPVIAFDRLSHVSLAYHKPVVADETRVVTIPHNDMDALEDLCRRERTVAYVADGVYSMGGSAPIAELRRLQERYGLFLYIDDAHGISIHGTRGEGYARSQLADDLGPLTIVAASLGKGFGASGGILMFGSRDHEALFRRYSLPHAFSAAPNLAAVGAGIASAEIHASPELGELQAKLAERIGRFDSQINSPQRGEMLPIRFIPVGEEVMAIAAARTMLDEGMYTSATFFPTVARGKAGIRICLTATHSLEDIDRLCTLLRSVIGGQPRYAFAGTQRLAG